MTSTDMITKAKALIAACERDLNRKLSRGERVDLLCDNTEWPLETCRAIVTQHCS